MKPKRIIIMGAAGRDFHNFNTVYREDRSHRVVAFTATQIPNIAGRRYPPSLSGPLYPRGIPVYPEEKLPELIRKRNIDAVIFSYSDLSHIDVMHRASLVNACGADFILLAPGSTMLESRRPVIAVTAVRTGCGKSQTTRKLAAMIRDAGKQAVIVRHPMPYGRLDRQVCQRFAAFSDLDTQKCTIEEREEYEPLIEEGAIVYAGVDYGRILREAERDADIVIWDGGNNDTPFFSPDLHMVILDPHRPGHEKAYHPGETNLRMADVAIINKEKTTTTRNIERVKSSIQELNPGAAVVDAWSIITVNDPAVIRKKKVLVVEDGPTLTHGGMKYGAGMIAARKFSARPVDPRPFARGSIKAVLDKYTHLSNVLPAMGYSPGQVKELEATINRAECDAVVSGTPVDLRRIISTRKPIVRIRYNLEEQSEPGLDEIIKPLLRMRKGKRSTKS